MPIAKKLFNFLFIIATLAGKKLTIQHITEEFKCHDKKKNAFSIKGKQNKTSNFQKTEPSNSYSSSLT